MDVESLAKQLILKGMTEEQQKAILESIKSTMVQARTVQKQRVGENVQVVVQALKKLENDIRDRYDEVAKTIDKRVSSIKDGQDGRNGVDGRAGKDGRPGRDGAVGPRGANGLDGRNGVDGVDGVSVTNAYIDFDGSLIINLSSGQALNVGEVVAPDLAEKIKVITNGGGTSQVVIDTLESLQSQIDALEAAIESLTSLTYKGTWNASTNVPALASSTGVKGDYYIVSVAGTTNLNGITDWQPGDWVIFNGTVWQKIDQSWATAGINDNITSMIGLTGGISSPDFVQFDTTAGATPAVGRLLWNNTEGTFEFGMLGGNVNLQLGMENVVRVKNDDTVNLTDGMVVYISGANGANLLVKRAQATSDGLSATTLGVVTEPIATNGHGYITTFGNVNGLNTTAFAAGDVLYLSPTTAGALTNVKPSAPDHMVTVAVCTKVSAGDGQIFARVDNGYELDELHNVLISGAASGNTLIYDAVTGVWKNANLTDGTGISITEGAGSITVTNTAPDQVVSLTGAGTTSVSGTYPSFTITSNDQYTGTVTSVAGTGTVNGISLSGTVTSSGSLTLGGALTGTASLNINGSVGATTPAAGTFTSLSDSGNLAFTGTGNRITGDFSNATIANRVIFQTSTVNGQTSIGVLPNGTSTVANLNIFGGNDPANAAIAQLVNTGGDASLRATVTGTGTFLPMTFYTGGSERMRVDTSGNLGIGTSSPANLLNIQTAATGTTVASNIIAKFQSNGTGRDATIQLSDNVTNSATISMLSGATVFSCNGVESARIDSSGNLLVGTTSASGPSRLRVVSGVSDFQAGGGVGPSGVFTAYLGHGNSNGLATQATITSAVAALQFYNPNGTVGSVVISGSSTAFNTSSDYRLKENVQPMTGALAKVAALKPCTYTWKADGSAGEGFIAHELQAVVPDAVTGEKDAVNEDGSIKPQGIDTSFLVATLTAAIQEQQQMIETLQAKVAALENA